MAPEILAPRPAYDLKCDLWSVGVILYELLGGCSPFRYSDSRQIFEATLKGAYTFDPKYFGGVSEKAKQLVCCLMTVNPSKRYSAHRALEHEWFEASEEFLSQELSVVRMRDLAAAQTSRRVKATVNAVCVANKLEALQRFDELLLADENNNTTTRSGVHLRKVRPLSTKFRAAVYTIMATRKFTLQLSDCSRL
eukprot:CAMPEP_0116842348 /NCGR_PEP_ID=MMETSP0418-20121206/11461_1 /TAXON_ID=1158023 /ORGANISM="Astrosyne radiata, Strain 13vi08-1A" /LENGTH=193 /DNA_ID=CAMNT_0004472937 /DNA_START=1 /DNA_END=582 /DNA_ORIENTATION=-